MSCLQPPWIGATVHYRSRGSADGVYPPTCRAAIVTDIAAAPTPPDPQHVALTVLNPTGFFFHESLPQDEGSCAPGTWHWPGNVCGGTPPEEPAP